MTGYDFDRLTKTLAARTSCRAVLKGLLGAAAGAVTGLAGVGPVLAACRRRGGACTVDTDCCQSPAPSTCNNGRCCPTARLCPHPSGGTTRCCPDGTTCLPNGTCCPTAQVCQTANGPRCCGTTRTCVNGVCCLNERVCIAPSGAQRCCGTGKTCVTTGACCPEGRVATRANGTTYCCSAGKVQDPDTGLCVCDPAPPNCPGRQDPDTCECIDDCDCSGFNNCSDHGICNESCTCQCEPPWFGAACDQLPSNGCADYTTCDACMEHLVDQSCVWCIQTNTGVCSRSDECAIFAESCPS